ncbi:TPA: hypothetical protein JHJ51_000962 [Enterobacter cloacae]|uniref:hypothetical protein n=1 Tax=Enterobacter cloacae TaxID=550 RepID=UPI00303E4639|nr:hypothetical protein [Enterobacter cloacae]EKX9063245.1 hypothetical protein [Enterobacter cloacae]HAV2025371.1 hypothetical protein [Enterobacter cloacae]HDC4839887.1 hypothetical protein [Enterobacter cloacae]
MKLKNLETHIYYSNDSTEEQQDKVILVDQNLVYSCCNGDEVEYKNGKKSDSPFYGKEAVTTLYITDRGNIQDNHDGSFYFRIDDGLTMASYVDGELMPEDPDGKFNDFVEFANTLV